MSSPDPNGNDGSGSGIGGLLDGTGVPGFGSLASPEAAGNALSGIAGSIGSALQSLATSIIKPVTDEIEAKSLNTLNQMFNTVFYGFVAFVGISAMAYGIYLLAKEAGADGSGAGDALMKAGSFVAGIFPEAKVATKLATPLDKGQHVSTAFASGATVKHIGSSSGLATP
jgi:hypothetical protein